jgi:SecD/SecF fusion protein
MAGIFLQSFLAQASIGDGASTVTSWQDAVEGFKSLGVMILAVVLPLVLSRFLAKQLKMPTHTVAFFWILLATLSTAFILSTGTLKKGPEIVGGTNFIYEINRSGETGQTGPKVVAKDFMVPLSNRLNPSGTKELLIRPIGDDQIEITIPDVDPAEKKSIQDIITNAGNLQFRIVANANDHKEIIDAATVQSNSPDQNLRMKRDVEIVDKTTNVKRIAGIWRTLGRGVEKEGVREISGYQSGDLIRNAQTGRLLTPPPSSKPNDFEKWVASQKINSIDVLLALEKFGTPYTEVTGADLKSAKKEVSRGGYQVNFTMSVGGAQKMLMLTGANLPSKTSDFKRRMAILLDGNVLSAPNLNSTIRGEGLIEGNFTEADVEFLSEILNAGSLPGALSKEPISENSIGASMGLDAITKSTYASIMSLIVTVLCVLVYYRFSGLIATVGLILNLGMIIAVMMLIKQPLTLSGMAGLVLSVGMSVDANVLVFERIREETEKRASAKMAIRNGFDRAWTTIFDSNLTTLITAVVLYFVGTEQIKGFAITLIIGLVISLFTAVFVTHKLFEIADRWKFAWLGMADYVNNGKRALFGTGDIDFMKYRFACYAASLVLILGGLIATVARGRQILDIDFNGGTSVVFSLDKGLPPDQVRGIANKAFDKDEKDLPIQSSLTSVDMKDFEKNSVYKLDVSLKDGKDVTSRLLKGFSGDAPARLVTFDLSVKPVGNPQSDNWTSEAKVRFVSFQEAEVKTDAEIQGDVAKPAPTAESKAKDAAVDAPPQDAVPSTSLEVEFKNSKGAGLAKMNAAQVVEAFINAAKAAEKTLVEAQIELLPKDAPEWNRESAAGYADWTVTIPFDSKAAVEITDKLRAQLQTQPVFQSVSKIESRVAGEMQQRAIAGLLLSLVFIVAYIWFRFQRIAYGIAAVVALIHDVLITLTFIAVSHWLFQPLGFLMIEDFKISLTIIAAFLTIIGYSLNDTIVVFDRIREVKGKSPNLSEKMINASVTQTLSRTLLTSSTTIIAIALMYIFGGEGIHGFAYCLLIGILVGTYSSIFIAAPILLWFVKREEAARKAAKVNA